MEEKLAPFGEALSRIMGEEGVYSVEDLVAILRAARHEPPSAEEIEAWSTRSPRRRRRTEVPAKDTYDEPLRRWVEERIDYLFERDGIVR
jgi:hypothetical protein